MSQLGTGYRDHINDGSLLCQRPALGSNLSRLLEHPLVPRPRSQPRCERCVSPSRALLAAALCRQPSPAGPAPQADTGRQRRKGLHWKQLRHKLRSLIAHASLPQPEQQQLRRRRVTSLHPFHPRKGPKCAPGIVGFPRHWPTGVQPPPSPASANLKILIPHQPWAAPTERFSFCCSACIHHSKSEISCRLMVFWLLSQSLPGPGRRMRCYGSVQSQPNNNHSPTVLPVHTQNTCPKHSLFIPRQTQELFFKAVNAVGITLFLSGAPSIRQFKTEAPASRPFMSLAIVAIVISY